MSSQSDDPAAAWRRFKSGDGPLHDLTLTAARVIHRERYGRSFDRAVEYDQWLAVGSWRTAEAVIKALPMTVTV